MEVRFDRGMLARPKRLSGSLVVEGHAARVHRPGDPLRYAHGDEYRDGVELVRIVDQLVGKPVTLGHPPGLIRDGHRGRVVGRVDAAWLDGDHAAVRMTLTDASAAHEIEAGTKELSLGYACDVRTDGHQLDTEVDHLAIVEKARCGATCSLRTDERMDCSQTCACQIDRSNAVAESGTTMADKTAQQRADELETTVSTLTAEVKRLEGIIASGAQAAESDQLKAATTRADAAEAKVARFDEMLEKRAGELAALRIEAMVHLGTATRLDGMSERQIQEAVVKRLDASANIASDNDDQLRGRYTTLTALASRNVESQRRIGEILSRGNSGDPVRADEEVPHEKDAWKQTLRNGQTKEGR